MDTFHIQAEWITGADVQHTTYYTESCRELFISALARDNAQLAVSHTLMFHSSVELPVEQIEEIMQVCGCTCEVRTTKAFYTYTYICSGETSLAAIYWLILLERLMCPPYTGTFLQRMTESARCEWDAHADKLRSIRAWNTLVERERKVPTNAELLRYRLGIIDFLKME